jgi:ATP:ADP antiporter, AAA family
LPQRFGRQATGLPYKIVAQLHCAPDPAGTPDLTTTAAANDVPMRIIGATRRELPAFALSFLYFFCVLAAYYVIRPVREQLGAAAGGSTALPTIWLIVFVVMLLLTPVYGALVARFPRRIFIPVVYAFFAAGMVLMSSVLGDRPPSPWLATGFYVWVSVFNLFVVAVFWSYMADIYTGEQARRLYGAIGIGGTLGAISGPLMAIGLVHRIGVDGLLYVSSGLLILAMLSAIALGEWSRRHGRRDAGLGDQVIGGSFWAGARLVFTHPFLRRMALLLLLSDMIGTVLYALNLDLGARLFQSPEDRTAFFGGIDLYTNVLQVALQLFIAPWLLTRFGPAVTLVAAGTVNAISLFFLATLPGEFWLMAALVVSRAGGYGLVMPARESLYTRVDREARYKAKSFIDTAVWRGGDVMATQALALLKSLGAGILQLGLICVGTAMIGVYLSRNIEKMRGLEEEKTP